MSKTIVSPVKEFPGSVELPDRLTLPQVLVIEQSVNERTAMFAKSWVDALEGTTEKALIKKYKSKDKIPLVFNRTEDDGNRITPVCACVTNWGLRGYNNDSKKYEDLGQLKEDTFPMTPRDASSDLIKWLHNEVMELYNPEVPNE